MTTTRLLIVDDNAQVRQDLATLLPLLGCIEVVGEAGDGAQAVRQAEALSPDVVLMDLEMPVLDGYEAGRRIKAEHPSIRVVVLSAYGGPRARDLAQAAGLDGFIDKGAPVETIVQAIQGPSTEN
jgi:DNA-binding NarL/FixJ family response regulator